MKKIWVISAIIPVILMYACVSPQQRREDYVNEHPDLSREVTTAVMEGRIMKGMSAGDVRAAWGDPDRETLSMAEGSNQEIWSYDTPVGKKFTEGTVILTLMNGKLINLVN